MADRGLPLRERWSLIAAGPPAPARSELEDACVRAATLAGALSEHSFASGPALLFLPEACAALAAARLLGREPLDVVEDPDVRAVHDAMLRLARRALERGKRP